eukprot:71137_1
MNCLQSGGESSGREGRPPSRHSETTSARVMADPRPVNLTQANNPAPYSEARRGYSEGDNDPHTSDHNTNPERTENTASADELYRSLSKNRHLENELTKATRQIEGLTSAQAQQASELNAAIREKTEHESNNRELVGHFKESSQRNARLEGELQHLRGEIRELKDRLTNSLEDNDESFVYPSASPREFRQLSKKSTPRIRFSSATCRASPPDWRPPTRSRLGWRRIAIGWLTR